jgi:hypothetical protein
MNWDASGAEFDACTRRTASGLTSPAPEPHAGDGWALFLWLVAYACLPGVGAALAHLRFLN